jgi:hypothetical protein
MITEHPQEQGVRWIQNKPYYWCIENGKHVLKAWPNDIDGRPVAWDVLKQKESAA